jgi:hypothetical protein
MKTGATLIKTSERTTTKGMNQCHKSSPRAHWLPTSLCTTRRTKQFPQEGIAERALFVVDKEGMIRWSYCSPVGVNPGADGILQALEKLES